MLLKYFKSANEICKILPWRRSKIQIGLFGAALVVLLFIFYEGIPDSYKRNNTFQLNWNCAEENRKGGDGFPQLQPFRGEKLVHVDLKGAPPLVSFFQEFFPYIRKFGATGILMEYEDTFFYRDELENLRAKNAYRPAALKKILKLAEENSLMIVPLVQTFGHFEYVLKLEEYKDLREVKKFPEVICPLHEKTLPLIKKMIGQVLEAHPNVKYIHIGGNEVSYLGRCEKCKRKMTRKKWTSPDLYLHHIKQIGLHINATYPKIRPIVWGDMITKFRKPILIHSKISAVVDVMVWVSSPNVPGHLSDKLLHILASVFKSIWIASAFKGATEVNQKVTDVSYYLKNHISWMEVVNKWKKHIHFKGIALTGRQRASHFDELCELLPVGVPSLTVNLIYLNGTDISRNNKSVKIFHCDHLLSFSPYSYHFVELLECNFPGFSVYRLINKFESLYQKIQRYNNFPKEGHFSLYHIAKKFGSPSAVKRLFEKRPVDEDLDEIGFFEEELRTALLEIYDQYTVQEWLDTYVTPAHLKVEALSYVKELLLEQETWPRRPLEKDENDFGEVARRVCSSENRIGCAALLL